MTRLPEVVLDDRGFQDLVNDARLRLARGVPRADRSQRLRPGDHARRALRGDGRPAHLPRQPHPREAPRRAHGARRHPAGPAERRPRRAALPADVRSEPARRDPRRRHRGWDAAHGDRAVGDLRGDGGLHDPPLRPTAYVLDQRGTARRVDVVDGTARPHGDERRAFASPPQPGDALLLGFDESIARLVLRVDVEASEARGAGIDPSDPPLRWEVSTGDDEWTPAEVLDDRTGGFNYGSGTVELQLPARSAARLVGGLRRHWLRCRIATTTRAGKPGAAFTHAPEIYAITAVPVGALIPAAQRTRCDSEALGVSDGTPGQVFALRTGRSCRSRTATRSRFASRTTTPGSPGRAASRSRQARRRAATSSSIPSAARSRSGRRSARRMAASRATARPRPPGRRCASRATTTAAVAEATSRPERSRR